MFASWWPGWPTQTQLGIIYKHPLRQQLSDVIAGFEAAWRFFHGVFAVVIPDNMKAIVDQADAIAPRVNDGFRCYAQARGFVVDPTRIRKPQDKGRVERGVPYVRESFFRGELFQSIDEAQRSGHRWCLEDAGLRIHGTTRRRPLEMFEQEERNKLLPMPDDPYEIPVTSHVTVQTDHHIVVGGALYSLPTNYIGKKVEARGEGQLLKVYYRGKLIKTHPRQKVGGRSTDPRDYPERVAIYATRDTESLAKLGHEAGEHIGIYVDRLLAGDMPWTRMRQVYRLLGLVRRYGRKTVDDACRRALELDVVDVWRVGRMLEQALETKPIVVPSLPLPAKIVELRFARPTTDFAPGGPRS